jgi:hypothetical protein
MLFQTLVAVAGVLGAGDLPQPASGPGNPAGVPAKITLTAPVPAEIKLQAPLPESLRLMMPEKIEWQGPDPSKIKWQLPDPSKIKWQLPVPAPEPLPLLPGRRLAGGSR